MADLNDFGRTVLDTAPEKVRDLPDDALEACHRYFVDILPELSGRQTMSVEASGRISLLRDEIRSRALAKQSDRQHEESMIQGSTILYWTKCAVAVGLLAILVALIADIPFSKLRPAKATQASPTSLSQATPTVAPSPVPTAAESPSETTPTSPTPSVTATPIKLPPPAP